MIIPCRWSNFTNEPVRPHRVVWDHTDANFGFSPATQNSLPSFAFNKYEFLYGVAKGNMTGMVLPKLLYLIRYIDKK